MKNITFKSTLFWYDGPQVFEARDPIGGHYVAVAIEERSQRSSYVVVGVAPERLRRLRAGLVDLRTVLIEAAAEAWYLAPAASDLAEPVSIELQTGSIAETGFLPDDGFLLHPDTTDEPTLTQSRERNKLVMELVAEPPRAGDGHRIGLDTYVDILGGIRTMVKHAYRAAWRDLSKDYRNMLDTEAGHMLEVVVPAAAGSFRVLLEATQPPNLIGESEVARALRRVDALFERVREPERAVAEAREHQGHLAGAYLKLLRVLVERETSLRYSWAEPVATGATQRSVTVAEAERLVPVLSRVTNLSTEVVTLVGEFERFNRRTGLWGLRTEKGKFSGKIAQGGPSLDGLEVGRRYRFVCTETIEETHGTGRDARRFDLTAHEPA